MWNLIKFLKSYYHLIIKFLRNKFLALRAARLILWSLYFIFVILYRCPLSNEVIKQSRMFLATFASLDTAENDGVIKLLGFLS